MPKLSSKIKILVNDAEAFFGARVMQVTAPGGKSRDSLRLHFSTHSVIATRRASEGRGRHERLILSRMGQDCDAVPMILGQRGAWYFQQDAGARRLSQAVQPATPEERLTLARKAIVGIFEVQRSANAAGLVEDMPRLGATQDWIGAVIDKPADLATAFRLVPPPLDRTALLRALDPPQRCFVKWDCRAGNAALDDDGHLRWFDFEYAGQRHGAEDFAWLIGDEVWPVAPRDMFDLISAIGADYGAGNEAYLDYLALYSAFHIVQRLSLIRSEVLSRGWLGMDRILRKDDVGASPLLAIRLCETGAWCAARHPLSAPLAPFFEAVGAVFAATMTAPDGVK